MDKIFSKEVRIALMAIVAIIVMFAGMNFLKGIIVLSDDNSYKVEMSNINGLAESSPIYCNGMKVGVVRAIDVDYENMDKGITVTIEVDKRMHIPEGSTAEVDADLMGNLKMNLILAKGTKFIEPGGTMHGQLASGVMSKVADMVPYIEKMLPKMDSILASVNTLLADPALAEIMHNTAATTANLQTSTAELNALMAQMNRQVPGMMSHADKTLANTEKLTANLAQVDVAATMASIDATLQNCKELTAKLNSTEGTMGKFMNDPALYNNLNATMSHADSLMIDLKAHPKRYVHFSIFGKKDK